jgi:hypothetical protein
MRALMVAVLPCCFWEGVRCSLSIRTSPLRRTIATRVGCPGTTYEPYVQSKFRLWFLSGRARPLSL